MGVLCDRCRVDVPDADVNQAAALAECKACGLIFDPTSQRVRVSLEQAHGAHGPNRGSDNNENKPLGRPLMLPRTRVRIPAGYSIEFEEPFALPERREIVSYREAPPEMRRTARPTARAHISFPSWKRGPTATASRVLLPICLLAIASIVSISLLGHTDYLNDVMAMIAAPTIIASVWLFLAYKLNATTITLRYGLLSIEQGPIFIGGNKVFLADDVEQLWCRRVIKRRRNLLPWRHARMETHYELDMALSGKRTEVLLKHIESAKQALYLEQALEYSLGIIDIDDMPDELPNKAKEVETAAHSDADPEADVEDPEIAALFDIKGG